MGKKSRHKRKYLNQQPQGEERANQFAGDSSRSSVLETVLAVIVKIGVGLSFLTPLIIFSNYYFPFVGLKSLYFMAACEVIFFAWLILAFLNKNYRPKLNSVLVAFALFLGVLIVSSLFGIDFSQSFWSKFERMTGLLMWLHIFGFFLAASCVIKKLPEWKKIFAVAVLIAILVSAASILEVISTKDLKILEKSQQEIASSTILTILRGLVYSDRGGFTLGNTSFLGSYLLFNIFLAAYLFFSPAGVFKGKGLTIALRVYSALAVVLGIVALDYNEARAAFGAVLLGLFLIFLAWFSFINIENQAYRRQSRLAGIILTILGLLAVLPISLPLLSSLHSFVRNYNLETIFYTAMSLYLAFSFWLWLSPMESARFREITKWIGRMALILITLVVLVAIVMLYFPNNPVHNTFGKMAGQARFVNWSIAWQGFLERPILGWGPENYILVFPKFFNTCLFIPEECGGEIWFDRAHNIIVDSLVTTGLVGLIAYLGLFFGVFFALSKKYFREKSIDFWTFAIIISAMVAYFIQNLTVFDMVVSLMMLALVLSFVNSLAQSNTDKNRQDEAVIRRKEFPTGLVAVIVGLFTICFLLFVYQPQKTDNFVIKAMQQDMAITNQAGALSREAATSSRVLNTAQEIDFVKFVIQRTEDRLDFYKQALGSSPLGKYQIREFFSQQFESFLQSPSYGNYFDLSLNAQYTIWQYSTTTFDYLIKELEKSQQESPFDYRSMLRLGDLTSLYGKLYPDKLIEADQVLKQAKELSPQNQQTYWLLAQNQIWLAENSMRNNDPNWGLKIQQSLEYARKSVDLNPKVWNSQQTILQVLQAANSLAQQNNNASLAKKYSGDLKLEIDKIVEFNPAWAEKVQSFRQ